MQKYLQFIEAKFVIELVRLETFFNAKLSPDSLFIY
jgi:hypothetical protein